MSDHKPRPPRTIFDGAVVILAAVVLAGLWMASPALTAPGHAQPTQAVTAPPPPGKEQATFAAGCFWSMEAIFKELKGVQKVEPGYAGGTQAHPSYEQVETGNTGYAESLNIIYDPKVITYKDLLRVLLTVRDPTTPNRQGPDEGPQYRSVIFYRSAAQHQAAQEAIRQIGASRIWRNPIVTEVKPLGTFYEAEGYHHNYYALHPTQGYCAMVIAPELAEFRAKFKPLLKQ